MQRIVHITTMHPSSDTRIFRNECISLMNAGFEVILIAQHPIEEVIDGVKIIPIPGYKSFWERIYKNPAKAIKIASKLNADIYHFHDPELLFVMALFAIRSGKRVIWDAHENYADTIYQFNSLKLKLISYFGAKLFGWFELYFSRTIFKGVVTVTDKMAQKYISLDIPTAIAGNFSRIENIPRPSSFKPKFPIVFISSGMQLQQRMVLEIAQAFELLNDNFSAILKFAGKFNSEELKSEIVNQVGPGKKHKVELTGSLTWDELVLVQIPNSHVGFVLFDTSDPNNCNGLPNRFFECWSNGVPVITTAGTRVAQIVEAENGGIVIPDNTPASISQAMLKFINSPELVETMGRNARKAVETKYCWDMAFANIEGLYKRVLDN